MTQRGRTTKKKAIAHNIRSKVAMSVDKKKTSVKINQKSLVEDTDDWPRDSVLNNQAVLEYEDSTKINKKIISPRRVIASKTRTYEKNKSIREIKITKKRHTDITQSSLKSKYKKTNFDNFNYTASVRFL